MRIGGAAAGIAPLVAVALALACKGGGSGNNAEPSVPETFRDRPVAVQGEVRIPEREVVLELSADGFDDGDIVSLYVNGSAVLSRRTLGQEPERAVMTFEDGGYNWVLLHAIDEGGVPPAAALLTLASGGRLEVVPISATRRESGALNVFVEAVD